jgi:hypothetical protein
MLMQPSGRKGGIVTTTGSPTRHAHNILALLDAVLLPKEVSVFHYRGHQKGKDKIAKGNKAADEAAKWAAMQLALSSGRGLPFPQKDHNIDQKKVNKALNQEYQLDH